MIDRQKPTSPKTVKALLAELVVAVEKIHGANISHGDLGFQNILKGKDGRPLLIDFGTSKWRKGEENSENDYDWMVMSWNCGNAFRKENLTDTQIELIKTFANMTDDKIAGEYIIWIFTSDYVLYNGI